MLDPATLLENNFKFMDIQNNGMVITEDSDFGFKSRRELEKTLSTLYISKQHVEYKRRKVLGAYMTVGFITEPDGTIVEIPQAPPTDWDAIRRNAEAQITEEETPRPFEPVRGTTVGEAFEANEGRRQREAQTALNNAMDAHQQAMTREAVRDATNAVDDTGRATRRATEAVDEFAQAATNQVRNAGMFTEILERMRVNDTIDGTELHREFEAEHQNTPVENIDVANPVERANIPIDRNDELMDAIRALEDIALEPAVPVVPAPEMTEQERARRITRRFTPTVENGNYIWDAFQAATPAPRYNPVIRTTV